MTVSALCGVWFAATAQFFRARRSFSCLLLEPGGWLLSTLRRGSCHPIRLSASSGRDAVMVDVPRATVLTSDGQDAIRLNLGSWDDTTRIQYIHWHRYSLYAGTEST